MNLTRRELSALIAGTVASSAGCLDAATGDESLRFEASEVRASETAVDETGYEYQTTETPTVTREFEVSGTSREVEAVNVVSKYDKAIDMGPLGSRRSAVFVAAATPQVEVVGRTFNPIEDMENHEVAEEFQSQYGDVTIHEELDESVISVFDEDVEFSIFDAETEFEGHTVDVYLHLGVAETDDDFVVLLGGYPQEIADEQANIVTLAESVEQNE